MTAQNQKLNIREELDRVDVCLQSVEVLRRSNLHSDAVSRLSYYVLYHVRALLLTLGMEARSHEDALRYFSLYFVKEGPFPASASHLFSRLMKYREEADYNPSYAFEASDVDGFIDEARILCKRIRDHLREQGLLG